jgi:ATP-binding cassette, subfamily B, bacterial PglK
VTVTDDQTNAPAPPRLGFRETWGAFLEFVEPGQRSPWVLLLGLAFFAAIVEMIGAALVYAIAGMFAADVDATSLPVIGGLVEQLGGGDTTREILLIAGIVSVFYVFRGATVLGEAYYQAKVVEETTRRLSVRLFAGYVSLPYPYFLRRNSAEMIRTAFDSVRQVGRNFLDPMVTLISDSLVAVGFVIVLVVAAPWASAMALVVLVPAVYLLLRWVRPKLQRLGRRYESENAASLQSLQHSLHGIREIKVSQSEAYFTTVFDRSRARLARIQYRRALLSEMPRVSVETLVVLLIVLLLVAASIGPFARADSLAVLGLFAYAALRLMPIVNRTAANINKIRFATGAVENVRRDLELVRAAASESTSDAPRLMLESAIELREVDFAYEKASTPALRDVELVIKRGERLGIVGQTGSGKSTLLDLILGLLSPTSGEVLVDGDPIESRLSAWLSNIGMVPQAVFLIDDSIRRNVAFGLAEREIDDERVGTVLELAQLSDFVDTLPDGVETVVGERGVRLSGGQQQRIAIARALYDDPAILILDEATSALDTATESELMEALEDASRDRTVIIVAHRLSTVQRADRVILLDDGRIVDSGRFDELVTRNASFRELTE